MSVDSFLNRAVLTGSDTLNGAVISLSNSIFRLHMGTAEVNTYVPSFGKLLEIAGSEGCIIVDQDFDWGTTLKEN